MDEAIIKKIMPHSIDSEKAVIGSMIMDADAIVAASEMLTGAGFPPVHRFSVLPLRSQLLYPDRSGVPCLRIR